jgi:drug/metabolite transporter (DMT)-like permease
MWALYATFAMFCFAGMQLLFKQLTRMGLASPVILVFVFGFGALLYLAHVGIAQAPLAVGGRAAGLLGAAAVCSYAGNLYMVRALGQAPNPGYAMAIVGLQALVVTVASIPLYGSDFSWTTALGVALSVVGVGLLTLDA